MPENVPRLSGQDTVLSIVKWPGSLLISVTADLCSQLWLNTALSWPIRLCSTVSETVSVQQYHCQKNEAHGLAHK